MSHPALPGRPRPIVPALVLLFCPPASLVGPAVRNVAAAEPEAELGRGLASFTRAFALIEENFADPVPADRTIYQGAIQGMLRTLDPHSNFLDPKAYEALQQDQRGQYYGVGMEINMDGPRVIITQPFPGSPASKAGLRRGDVIHAIDGKSAEGLNSGQVADRLKGPKGTAVEISVVREGVPAPLTFRIQRGEISRSEVEGFWLRPGVAYLRINSFNNQNTAHEVERVFRELGEDKVAGLVLDLRGNPGGLVSEAVSVAGRFLQKGQTVVSHRGRASAEQVFRAQVKGAARKYPIAVMVDRYSASAAEIVAGALQDHDRAWVIGEGTFGKGLVQAQYPLSEGTALLLTIARYYTPSGRLIQRDYEHTSFFDYYSHRDTDARNMQDVRQTDSGRTVYGGGGITPDQKFSSPRMNTYQRRLAGNLAFFRFANSYFGGQVPSLPDAWTPSPEVLKRFQGFLIEHTIPFSDTEFEANREWTVGQMRSEMYLRAFSRTAASRVTMEDDPEVRAAVASLPRAQALLDQVRMARAAAR